MQVKPPSHALVFARNSFNTGEVTCCHRNTTHTHHQTHTAHTKESSTHTVPMHTHRDIIFRVPPHTHSITPHPQRGNTQASTEVPHVHTDTPEYHTVRITLFSAGMRVRFCCGNKHPLALSSGNKDLSVACVTYQVAGEELCSRQSVTWADGGFISSHVCVVTEAGKGGGDDRRPLSKLHWEATHISLPRCLGQSPSGGHAQCHRGEAGNPPMTGRRGELAFLTAPSPRTSTHYGPPGVSAHPVHLACTPMQVLMLHSAACFRAAATAES